MKTLLTMGMASFALLMIGTPCTLSSQPDRKWQSVSSSPVARLDDASGLVLAHPAVIKRCADGVAVLDIGSTQVIRLSRDLRVLWRFGREGSGPGEFREPTDLSCAEDGTVFVADAANARVTVLSPRGRLDTLIVLQDPPGRVAAAPRGGSVWLTGASSAHIATRLSLAGGRSLSVAAPAEIAALLRLQLEGWISPTRDSGVVIAYRWSSKVQRIAGDGRVLFSVHGPERIDYPAVRSYAVDERGAARMVRIAADALEAVKQLDVLGGDVYLLFAGGSKSAGSVVDRLSLESGRYLGSLQLPLAPYAFAVSSGRIYVIQLDPAPAILAFELPSAPGGSRSSATAQRAPR